VIFMFPLSRRQADRPQVRRPPARRPLIEAAAITLVLLLAATPAHAGLLALDFQGVAWADSSLNGTPIGGTSFTVQIDFDPTTITPIEQGAAFYAVTSIDVAVGGTTYMVTNLSDFSMALIDATNPTYPGIYDPGFYNSSDNSGFSPSYTTATPAFSATDPTPTVFSGYSAADSFGNYATFSTADGPLILIYDNNVGIDASINSVPEPSSLAFCGIGVSIGLMVAWRRRQRAP
jgi:PEP-CTERM motif